MNLPIELYDLAFEAALVPERWKGFLDAAAKAAGARGGTLFAVEGLSEASIISDSLHDVWQELITTDWRDRNPFPALAVAKRCPGFLHDLEVLPALDRQGVPWFTEFSQKWNLGPSLGTVLQVPNGSRLIFTVERPTAGPVYERSDVDRFNLLRPSIARAVALASQVAFQQFDTTTMLLNALSMPCAVITERGRVLSANTLFQDHIPDTFVENRNGLHIQSPHADALLQKSLFALRGDYWLGAVASIPIPKINDSRPPAIAHILPVRGLGRDILFGATFLVLVDQLKGRSSPSDTILRALYDLTPAEARVAAALTDMRVGPAEVARRLGISVETVKSQTKSIYQKTGLSGVIELSNVLGGVLKPIPNDSN